MTAIRLAELPGHRLAAAVAAAPLAVLPTGSIEYHGPHGPFGTDLHLAEVLSQRVADDLDALLLPAVPFSHCPPATRAYTGTIDIAEATLAAYLGDILAGVYQLGVRCVLVLNAHDGNIRPVHTAGDLLASRFQDRALLLVNWWETLSSAEMEAMGLFTQDGGHGHGGPLEMSAAEAAQPGTVDWSVARDLDVIFSPGENIVRGVNQGRPLPNWEGYHGRVTEGSLAKGQTLLQLASECIVRLTRAWLEELSATA